jgi:hypothetical protein
VKPVYAAWIQQHVPSDPSGMCDDITRQMADAFPELKRVRGHYDAGHKRYSHWWLVTQDGAIVDPTEAQFVNVPGWHDPHDESGPEPTGKCPNCSGYVYDGGTVCGDVCADAYARYCMGL